MGIISAIEQMISAIPIIHSILYFLEYTSILFCLLKFQTTPKAKLSVPETTIEVLWHSFWIHHMHSWPFKFIFSEISRNFTDDFLLLKANFRSQNEKFCFG
jgi:hypothetical protein